MFLVPSSRILINSSRLLGTAVSLAIKPYMRCPPCGRARPLRRGATTAVAAVKPCRNVRRSVCIFGGYYGPALIHVEHGCYASSSTSAERFYKIGRAHV